MSTQLKSGMNIGIICIARIFIGESVEKNLFSGEKLTL